MLDNKSIDKKVIIIVAIAVAVVLGALVTFGINSSSGIKRNGIEMEYETTLFGDENIDVNIEMSDSQWQELLDNAVDEEYYSADVTVNGIKYKNVGVRAKGNTSLSQVASTESDRFSLKIKFDEYVDGQNCDGLTKLVLNNNYCDATMMKEAICYDMFKFLGADASLYNYAKVSVNGEYTGLYLALEPVEESFCRRVYGEKYGMFYKPDSMEMGGGKGNMKNFDKEAFEEKFGQSADAQQQPEMQQGGAPPEMPDGQQGGQPGDQGGQQPPEMPNAEQGGQPGGQGGQQPPDMQQGGGMPQGGQQPPERPNGEQGGQQPDSSGNSKMGGPGGAGGGSDLNYIDDELDSYDTIWDGAVFDCSTADKTRLIKALKELCDTDASYVELSKYIDMEYMAKYMAVHTFAVNLDSLSGNMTHNYYLYEYGNMLNLIPWDYNLAFGGFQQGDASSMINFSIAWPFRNLEESDRQLFANLLNCDEFKEMYYDNLQKLSEEYVQGGMFASTVKALRSRIDELVKTDPTSFYSNSEYETAQKTFVKVVPLRAKAVLAQIDDENATVDASGINLSDMGAQGGDHDKQPNSVKKNSAEVKS